MGGGYGAGYVKKRKGTTGVDLRCISLIGRRGGKCIGSEPCSLCLGGRGRDFRMQTNMCLLNNE